MELSRDREPRRWEEDVERRRELDLGGRNDDDDRPPPGLLLLFPLVVKDIDLDSSVLLVALFVVEGRWPKSGAVGEKAEDRTGRPWREPSPVETVRLDVTDKSPPEGRRPARFDMAGGGAEEQEEEKGRQGRSRPV